MKKTSILFLISLLWLSCSKEKVEFDNQFSGKSDSYYNNSVKKIAKSLSLALVDSKDLRKIIKEEALKKFDGDYDIMMKTLLDKQVSTSNNNSLSFQDLIKQYLPKDEPNTREQSDLLLTLMKRFPDLQVSVPVNAENWNENYSPVVAIQPDDFKHGTDTHVPGFKNGNPIQVDARNPPVDNPIVVVGLNERGGEYANLQKGPNVSLKDCTPIVTIQLIAQTWTSSIHLSWTVGPNTGGQITHYQIYRKEQGSTNFVSIGYSVGENNTTYTDYLLLPNNQYEYFVVAGCQKKNQQSVPSNIATATAPDRPNPPIEFEVFQTALNEAEVRWNHPTGETIISSNLYRKVDGVDTDWVLIATPGPNEFYFIDNNVPGGKKVNYKLQNTNLFGISDPKYDFIMGSFRDISQPSSIYIDAIAINADEVEHFIWGAPELVLSIASVDPITSESKSIQDVMILAMCHRNFSSFDNKLALNWGHWNWEDILTFKMVEHDNLTFNGSVSFTAKFKTKVGDKSSFGIDGSATATLTYNGLSEDCGVTHYNYYDPVVKVLEFPNFDAQLLLRNSDPANQCN